MRVELEVTFRCSVCGTLLEAKGSSDYEYLAVLGVAPCPECLRQAKVDAKRSKED